MRAAPHLLLPILVISLVGSCGPGPRPGAVRPGQLKVEGTVDSDYLGRQLLQLHPRFEACYARALRLRGEVEGTIGYRITGGGGKLVPEVAWNSTDDEPLETCVTGAIAGLAIVEPEGSEPWDFALDWPIDFVVVRAK